MERFERFSLLIADLSRQWHKVATCEMEKYGLKGPHSVYLLILERRPEGVTASQLCELCIKDKADVSRMMSIMEQKGLVYRSSPGGAYRGLFCLTEEGRRAAEQVRSRSELAVELAGKDLTDLQRAVMYEAMESIAVNLRQLARDGLPDSDPAPEQDSEA